MWYVVCGMWYVVCGPLNSFGYWTLNKYYYLLLIITLKKGLVNHVWRMTGPGTFYDLYIIKLLHALGIGYNSIT